MVGEPVAIHAAKRTPDIREWTPGVLQALEDAEVGLTDLPLGSVVAIAKLAKPRRVEDVEADLPVGARELELGDFSLGRWAWPFEDLVQIEPVECIGKQGLWHAPDEKLDQLRDAYRRGLRTPRAPDATGRVQVSLGA